MLEELQEVELLHSSHIAVAKMDDIESSKIQMLRTPNMPPKNMSWEGRMQSDQAHSRCLLKK